MRPQRRNHFGDHFVERNPKLLGTIAHVVATHAPRERLVLELLEGLLLLGEQDRLDVLQELLVVLVELLGPGGQGGGEEEGEEQERAGMASST